MVYTGRADSEVHGRVKKFEGGEGRWASYSNFQLYHSTRPLLARLLNQIVYTGQVKHAFLYLPLYSAADSTNVK